MNCSVQVEQQMAVTDRLACAHDQFSCCIQLEEANRTLTSDVANLANEKEELNNKLREATEGTLKRLNFKCFSYSIPENKASAQSV